MSKKNNQAIVQAEVLSPVQSAPIDARKMIEEMVQQKVAEITVRQDDFILQPFFLPRKVSDQIKWLQSVPEQRAWSRVFEKRGCIVCRRKDVAYLSCGCCQGCYKKIWMWKKAATQEIDRDLPEPPPIRDLKKIARAALFSPPTVSALPAAPDRALIPANDPPALKVLPTTTTAKTKKTRRR